MQKKCHNIVAVQEKKLTFAHRKSICNVKLRTSFNFLFIMAEKKATTKAAATKTTAAKTTTTTTKKATTKKCAAKAEVMVDAENAGFRAGDVYQALSAAGSSLSVAELAKATAKTETEVLLGIGWLLKEGKVKGDNGKVVLA